MAEDKPNIFIEMLGGQERFAELLAEGEKQHLLYLAGTFVRKREDNFIAARSIVMDIHLIFDNVMTFVISALLEVGFLEFGTGRRRKDFGPVAPSGKLDLTSSRYDKIFGVVAREITFSKKQLIIKSMNIIDDCVLSIIKDVNILRNTFAHIQKTKGVSIEYCKESIFNKTTVKRLIKDHEFVLHEFIANVVEHLIYAPKKIMDETGGGA